jgi:hypothetical protein
MIASRTFGDLPPPLYVQNWTCGGCPSGSSGSTQRITSPSSSIKMRSVPLADISSLRS